MKYINASFMIYSFMSYFKSLSIVRFFLKINNMFAGAFMK